MLVAGSLRILLALLSVSSSDAADNTPQLVYGTYLGGRDKECATSIAVDNSGAAYVVGRTPSPDFPVTNDQSGAATVRSESPVTQVERGSIRVRPTPPSAC